MSNNLGLSGAQPQKQTRFAPLYTGRWSSGIWTNRSPLRDAATSRIAEKFYGQAGDALISGSNVEITNKLTLARRPGVSVFDSNSYTNVDRFYEFRLFNTSIEEIILMIDQSNALYSLSSGTKTLVFTKSTGAGQTYMQSVGNILYFTDGVDNKKWLQTLQTWQPTTVYGTDTLPFGKTFFIDANNNLLQLYGTTFTILNITVGSPTSTSEPPVTITISGSSSILSVGTVITYTSVMPGTVSAFTGYTSTITAISGSTLTVTYPIPWLIAPTTQAMVALATAVYGGNPVSSATQPVGPAPTLYTGITGVIADLPNLVVDGSVLWLNKGPLVENWGISNVNTVPITTEAVDLGALIGTGPKTIYQTGHTYPANSYVVDPNNNIQFTSAGGTGSGATPTFSQILGESTTDGTITWVTFYLGVLSTFNGGWRYCVALVNTLDNTVSNASPLSLPTGNFIGAAGVQLFPTGLLTTGGGPGLQRLPLSGSNLTIDPQADYVAIFRTTDGQSVPFLIPGKDGQIWTVSLSDFLQNGYIDTTQDTQLNNLISAPISGENTPAPAGAINLEFHLNRIWYSIGNVVYWTSGPDDPVGNGLNGYGPLNFAFLPSLVKRLVRTTAGMLVFTVSDVFIIQGLGTSSSPIQGAQPLLPGIGLSSYNALDINGAIIGLFTTDNQFVILDPSSGVSYAGFPIGDQLRLNNGHPGQSWNPANVYVAWHVQGEDAAWYVCDGLNGWYRLMSTPAPETGMTWSPFATITSGVLAVQSIEVTPGVHKLLLGPVTTGTIGQRDLTVFSDEGTPYSAYATIGSAVLTQPGQIALVDHIVTDAVRVGSPLRLGLLIDEALPYYTGPIDIISNWEPDPPNLPESRSLYSQRFYLSQLRDDAAACRHLQVQVIFSPNDTVMNELFTLSIFGSYNQEI